MIETDKSLNSLKRHFNYPSASLDNLPKEVEWTWSTDGTSFSNYNRNNFPVLNEIKNEEFADLKNVMKNYEDVIYANRDYKRADDLRKIYCSHIVNHVLKTRSILKKNNDRISDKGDKISGIRDQGFHQCRVLIIAPTRYSALQTVNCLRSCMPEHKVDKKWKVFLKEYSEQTEESDDNDSDASMNDEVDDDDDDDEEEEEYDEEAARGKELLKKINENIKISKAKKIVQKSGIDFDEWQLGNTNEKFVIGLSVEKHLLKVNTMFNNSDIIIGSPMALREIVDDKKNYMNQLVLTSSIEILVMDQVEYMLMQNFDNIYPILEKLNQMPRGGGDCIKKMNSTLRVYEWALANQANKYRQNIVFSSILHPFIKKFMSFFHNFQGTSIFLPQPQISKNDLLLFAERLSIPSEPRAKKQKLIQNNNVIQFTKLPFSVPIPQEYESQEFNSCDILDNIKPTDSRISLFKRKVFPILINKLNNGGVLIYFTQTIDLYNVQSLLKSENLNVAVISEDQSEENIRSIITLFAKGVIKYVLLSERYYALTRQRISAVKHLIYYSTPSFSKFARDFHEFMLWNSKATAENPHQVINLCENELFEQINSQLAFKLLYGQ